jgi:hypothetical protein
MLLNERLDGQAPAAPCFALERLRGWRDLID